jgi:hypothetical protein
MPSITTPLQLTATAALLQNQGLKPFPPSLATAISAFNATTLISNLAAAVSFYKAQTFATAATLNSLLSMGNTACPALGNSIPASPLGTYTYLNTEYLVNYLDATDGSTLDPSGFSNLIEQTCAAYLGNGDSGRFSQGFMAVQSYIASTNSYINSAANANEYLGPTFTNMDNLVTGSISSVTTDLESFGVDLYKQGQLWNTAKLDLYGTPAGLLQQISARSGIQGRSVPALQNVMLAMGTTANDIENLVTDNRVGVFNPTGISNNEFDRSQRLAYNAFTMISGDPLVQILDILDVTTPNITSLDQLLDPVKTFPLSYASLQAPGANGPVPIFSANGSVNSSIAPIVNSYLPAATGCDELGKIIPPADAVANKAIQVALQQINNIPNVPLPDLAQAVLGAVDNPWNPADTYLANDVVSVPGPSSTSPPKYYRAKSPGCTPANFEVPAGTDINDTDYWTPTTLGGLSTMADLPLIQEQSTPVDASVTDFFNSSVATGTGPCGVITTYDVLGLALDADDFAARLTDAADTIDGLGTGLDDLSQIYIDMLSAANNAAMIALIADANTEIDSIRSVHPAEVATMNANWVYMANLMNLSARYTTEAGIDYFNLQSGDKNSVYGFVQNLPQYGLLTANGDAAEFLDNLADTAILGGQAIVGVLREGRNQARLDANGIYNTNQVPSNAEVEPIPVVLPVN